MSKYMEVHKFNTEEAALAFCRVHTEFSPVREANGYLVVFGKHYIIDTTNYKFADVGVNVQNNLKNQLQETVSECRLSYKNIITAGLLGSLTSTKYKIGKHLDMSHPVLFTYGVASSAPFLTLYSLFLCAWMILFNTKVSWIDYGFFILAFIAVEFLLPWINSYNYDPVEEPWLVGKYLQEQDNNQ